MMITAGLIHLKNNPQAFGKTADGEDHMIDRNTQVKIEFSGTIRSVQPRSNVWRYRLDNRTHSMTGYNLSCPERQKAQKKISRLPSLRSK